MQKIFQFFRSGKVLVIVIIASLITILAGSSYYFFNKYRQTQRLLANPTEAGREEAKQLTTQVGKLIKLPLEEQPTVATIVDAEKLKDQPFFANAKNGDKVLLYTNARKVILFRPAENKIVDVAPININTQNNQPQAEPIAPSPLPTAAGPTPTI